MASIKLTTLEEPLTVQAPRAAKQTQSMIARGTTGGARLAAVDIRAQGQQAIARSGNFGARWTEGLNVEVIPRTGALLNARIDVSHEIWFAPIHEFGGIIRGKPLLWIPLSFSDAVGTSARDYSARLFRVDRKGGKRPLLLSRTGPKYFGIEQVELPPRWGLRAIGQKIMNNFAAYYNRALKA